MSDELAISILENRVRVEESCIHSNQRRLDDADGILKDRKALEERSAAKIAHYLKCIELEKAQLERELALAAGEVTDRTADVERSKEAIASLQGTLARLRGAP